MRFEAKVFKLGNSRAVYIPKEVYTRLEVGKVYTFDVQDMDVYTGVQVKEKDAVDRIEKIKKSENTKMEWCKKHDSWKHTCGCR